MIQIPDAVGKVTFNSDWEWHSSYHRIWTSPENL